MSDLGGSEVLTQSWNDRVLAETIGFQPFAGLARVPVAVGWVA